jgi:tRNA(His) 5'-end guanylyltransferase
MCTAFFNKNLEKYVPEKADKMACFDCRVWNVPNLSEATNNFVWRELDATKNAISMAAQHYFSHKELNNRSGAEKQDMLFTKGVNFNDYPSFFKRGSYVRRVTKVTQFTTDEIESLHPMHEARRNPNLQIERSVIERVELPPITKIVNKIDVLFNGKEPELATL